MAVRLGSITIGERNDTHDEPRPNRFLRAVAAILILTGTATLLAVILALTPYPGKLNTWLAAYDQTPTEPPDILVLLGGGGVPSESGLMRAYIAADAALTYTNARVVIALPSDSNSETNSVGRMRDELVMRGVHASRIGWETKGRNTREQALNIAKILGDERLDTRLAVVTSEYHVRRAILAFRRVGFTQVSGVTLDSVSAEADMSIAPGTLDDGRNTLVPRGERNLTLRDHFWSNLTCEARAGREITALLYYRMRGWI